MNQMVNSANLYYFESPDRKWRQDPSRTVSPSGLSETGRAVPHSALDGGYADTTTPAWVESDVIRAHHLLADAREEVGVRTITAKPACPTCGDPVGLVQRKSWASSRGIVGVGFGVKHLDDESDADDACQRGSGDDSTVDN